MFGHITVNRGELKVRELDRYQSWYCGLCCSLGERSGIGGRLTLTYDMTFLTILLSSLYDKPRIKGKTCCVVHPLGKHRTRRTEYTDYGADMNVLLSYYDMLDDWQDNKSHAKLLQAKALKKRVKEIRAEYPRQSKAIEAYIHSLSDFEKEDDGNIEYAAVLTGRMLGELFVMEEDVWSGELRTMGFFLGKFIYLMDAYEDLEKDIKSGSYNPLKKISDREDFDDICKDMLLMQMSECCRAFERLPLVRDVGILRNILYSGVWTGFAKHYRQKKKLKA